MKKELGIIIVFLLFVSSVFGYNYVTNFYDYRDENRYKVCATNTAFANQKQPLIQINDLNKHISRCYVLPDDKSVMNMYEILTRMNTATLEEVIRTTKWEFWFKADNGWLFYRDADLY